MRFEDYCRSDARCLIDGALTKIKGVVVIHKKCISETPSLSDKSDKSRREMNLGYRIERSHVQQL